jgi:thiol-disulfide isomerase/thioredoxin
MMKSTALLSILALAIGLSACDFIDGPKVDVNGFPPSGNKVVIEDFTGHQCGNCPRAHEKAQELLEAYGDNLIVIAVHAGGFARVNSNYPTEFRTSMGDELEAYYEADLQGLPIGMVNRRTVGASPLVRHANWSTAVASILSEAPKLKIDLAAAYDETTREISVEADLEYFSDAGANHYIVALITEDSIVSKQSDYSLPAPSYIPDYVQMHVLRTTITPGTWGESVKGAPIFAGEQLTKNFAATLDTAWDAKHCEVVVYVIDNTTKEILQAQKTGLAN